MKEFWKQFFGFWNNVMSWSFRVLILLIICYFILHLINGGNI